MSEETPEPILRLPADARPYGDEEHEQSEEPEDQLKTPMLPVGDRRIPITLELTVTDAMIFVGWLVAKNDGSSLTVPDEVAFAIRMSVADVLGFYNPPPPARPEPTELAEPGVTEA